MLDGIDVSNNPVNWVDPWGLEWVSTGPHWYEFHYEYDPGELEELECKINQSGASGFPDLAHWADPVYWPFGIKKYSEDHNDENKGEKKRPKVPIDDLIPSH